MDAIHSGVFYQAMPAVGVDGKKIMALIPVKLVNGQFVQNQMRKPRMDSAVQKPTTMSTVPVHVTTAVNPPATQQTVTKHLSPEKVSTNQVGSDPGNSRNKQLPQQHSVSLTSKVPPSAKFATTCLKSVSLPCHLPVTVKSPALPKGKCIQIPPNAHVRTVPASELPPFIKKQICNSSTDAAPNAVYVSPVNTVHQGSGPINDSASQSPELASETSTKTPCRLPAERAKTLLKLIPKASQRPNGPTKWMIEEEDSPSAPNQNSPNAKSLNSQILQAVAQRENADQHCDTTNKTVSDSTVDTSWVGRENALVMFNGKVFFVAKKRSLQFKMGQSASSTAAPKTSEINKTKELSPQKPAEPDGAQTLQDTSIIIPDESDEVIDLCDDDTQGDLSKAATISMSAVSHQDDDNVIFVSYIPPNSEAESAHNSIVQTQMTLQKERQRADRSNSDNVTTEKSPDARSSGGDDDGRYKDQSTLVKNNTYVYDPVVTNMKQNEGSNIKTEQKNLTEQVETTVETRSPADPSSFRTSAHKQEQSSPHTGPCHTSVAAGPCEVADHVLRQLFGITADVKIMLQRIDEALAEEPVKSKSIRSSEDHQEPVNGLNRNLFMQSFNRAGKIQKSDTCRSFTKIKEVRVLTEEEQSTDPVSPIAHTEISPLKNALFSLNSKHLNALKTKCHSGQVSPQEASCNAEIAPVIDYEEPIDEDFPELQDTPAQGQAQIWEDLETNTRRIRRMRKRTTCPCCIPGTLEPVVKSSVRLVELERAEKS